MVLLFERIQSMAPIVAHAGRWLGPPAPCRAQNSTVANVPTTRNPTRSYVATAAWL